VAINLELDYLDEERPKIGDQYQRPLVTWRKTLPRWAELVVKIAAASNEQAKGTACKKADEHQTTTVQKATPIIRVFIY